VIVVTIAIVAMLEEIVVHQRDPRAVVERDLTEAWETEIVWTEVEIAILEEIVEGLVEIEAEIETEALHQMRPPTQPQGKLLPPRLLHRVVVVRLPLPRQMDPRLRFHHLLQPRTHQLPLKDTRTTKREPELTHPIQSLYQPHLLPRRSKRQVKPLPRLVRTLQHHRIH
jgi:hypothetical protein